jgi:hypothetical protein
LKKTKKKKKTDEDEEEGDELCSGIRRDGGKPQPANNSPWEGKWAKAKWELLGMHIHENRCRPKIYIYMGRDAKRMRSAFGADLHSRERQTETERDGQEERDGELSIFGRVRHSQRGDKKETLITVSRRRCLLSFP